LLGQDLNGLVHWCHIINYSSWKCKSNQAIIVCLSQCYVTISLTTSAVWRISLMLLMSMTLH